MIITSYGAAGYLSDNFQKATLGLNTSSVQLAEIEKEKNKLEARKTEIDKQIAQIPPDMVRARIRLTNNFKTEITRINERLVELDKIVPELKTKQLEVEAHIGPISYISKLFGITMEQSVSVIIGLIIFVFEPLAIMLILAGNFLQRQREDSAMAQPKIIPPPSQSLVDSPVKDDDITNAPLVTNEPPIEEISKEVTVPSESRVEEEYDDFGFEKAEVNEIKKLIDPVDHLAGIKHREKITMNTNNNSDYTKQYGRRENHVR